MTKVLVVEDEAGIRENIAEILTYEGYATLEAENGLVGLQMAQEHLPDLIISDIMMPYLDGYGLLLKLSADPITANIPFIFLTARTDKPSMRQGMDMGADDFLTKPVTTRELLSAITIRLEKHARIAAEHDHKFDELRNNLLLMLPHELRTPLTGIIGYSELIMMDAEILDRRQMSEMAKGIFNSSNRLSRLIENYLLYAQLEMIGADSERIQAFRKRMVKKPEDVIRRVATQKAEQVQRVKDLIVIVNIPQPVQIAEDDLQKIMHELLDNAFKFSQNGTPVEVRGEIKHDEFVLSISNQGRGMTANEIKNIGAYMQFERKIHEQQGSGLGLILSRRIVQLYDGEMDITSTPGEQTTVFVSLPLIEA